MPYAIHVLLSLLAAVLPSSAATADFDHSHALFHQDLQAYVKDGSVDYRSWSDNDQRLNQYLQALKSAQPDDWSREQKLAFWINTYNAWTIRQILDFYPFTEEKRTTRRFAVNSIRQIKGVWKAFRFDAGGRRLTLDEVEHKILRAELNEPRIHFGVVCASIGCPALSNEVFRPDTLDAHLDRMARGFVNDPGKNRVDHEKRTIYLSKIFEWFGEDFETYAKNGRSGPVSFAAQHLSAKDQDAVMHGRKKYRVDYLAYDWSLNGQ